MELHMLSMFRNKINSDELFIQPLHITTKKAEKKHWKQNTDQGSRAVLKVCSSRSVHFSEWHITCSATYAIKKGYQWVPNIS